MKKNPDIPPIKTQAEIREIPQIIRVRFASGTKFKTRTRD